MKIADKKILVTGASGLVGSQLCRELVADNDVWGLASFRNPEKRSEIEDLGVNVIARDVSKESIDDLPTDFDIVFHQLVILYESDVDPQKTVDVNTYFTGRLIDHCRDMGHLVMASTGGVYRASLDYDKETDAPGPVGWYATSKLGMEHLGTYLCQKHEIPAVILRYFWPYGKEQGRVTRMMKSIVKGEKIQTSSTQEDRYQPIHITDLSYLTMRALMVTSQDVPVYNMAGPEEVTWKEMALLIGQELGVEPQFEESSEARLSHLADLSRLYADIGKPKVGIKEGIHRLRLDLGF